MPDRLLELYLRSLREDHASGEAAVKVSGYGALVRKGENVAQILLEHTEPAFDPLDSA